MLVNSPARPQTLTREKNIFGFIGQERFQSITNRFYSDSQAVVIVYDITADDTLHDIEFWVREIQYYLLRELEEGMPIIFVGNKKDLMQKKDRNPGYREEVKDSTVIFRQVQEISNANGYLRPVECSAKTGENVQRVFHTIARELVKRRSQGSPRGQGPNVVRSKRMCGDTC